jgi:hypothetical protein
MSSSIDRSSAALLNMFGPIRYRLLCKDLFGEDQDSEAASEHSNASYTPPKVRIHIGESRPQSLPTCDSVLSVSPIFCGLVKLDRVGQVRQTKV